MCIRDSRQAAHRKGKIQLIDARERWTPMKRSLGDKRRYLDQVALDTVPREPGALENNTTSRVFDHSAFGYRPRRTVGGSIERFDSCLLYTSRCV